MFHVKELKVVKNMPFMGKKTWLRKKGNHRNHILTVSRSWNNNVLLYCTSNQEDTKAISPTVQN